MHLPEIDKYSHIRSPFSSWDPRVKIVSLSILIVSVVLTPGLTLASIGLVLAIILFLISRIPVRFALIHLRWVLLFALFFFIVMPLTVPDRIIARISFISISLDGVRLAALVALRAISAVILIFPMIATSRFDITIKALQKLKVPDKLVQLIMFSYRYIFVIMGEVRRMLTAARIRGLTGAPIASRLRITGNILGMLFIRSFERTQRTYQAMTSRGYDGRLKTLGEFSLCGTDFLKASLIIGLAVLLNIAGWLL